MTHVGAPAEASAEVVGQIRLDGNIYPCERLVRYTPTARFARRVTFGDASRDSDDVISVDIMFDWSGGGQIETRNEGSDQGRFWWSTLHTRDPYALTLAREVVRVAGDNTDGAWPLGDLAGEFYADFGLKIQQWDEATDTFGPSIATLDDHPVNRAIAFGETGPGSAAVLWIPQGSAGYQTFDGSTLSAQDTTVTPVAFCEWDNRLWALSHDGTLSDWDGSAWVDHAQLDARHAPKHLIAHRVADGEYALHAITDHGVLVYDDVFDVWRPTDLTWAVAHPGCGRAAAGWAGGGGQPGLADGTGAAGGDLYVASAMQVHRYTLGSTIAPIGPQRDHGLPAEIRGQICSLVGEKNGLYALIEGATETEDGEPGYAFSEMGWNEDQFVVGASKSYSALMVWTGIGWHTSWVSDTAGGAPTLVTISGAGDAYRLWWGYAGNLYTIELPSDDHLPRQGLRAGIDRFQPTGYLETGWFDAQMAGFRKLASHLQVNLERCESGCAVQVRYMVDNDEDWTPLGDPLTYKGKRTLSFGFEGVSFQRIRFRVEMSSDDATESPLIDSMILHYDKIPHDAGAWEVTITLDNLEGDWGRGPAAMLDELQQLLVKPGFVRFTLGGTDYRVRIAAMTGAIATGSDPRGQLTLSIIEIVDEEDDETFAEVA